MGILDPIGYNTVYKQLEEKYGKNFRKHLTKILSDLKGNPIPVTGEEYQMAEAMTIHDDYSFDYFIMNKLDIYTVEFITWKAIYKLHNEMSKIPENQYSVLAEPDHRGNVEKAARKFALRCIIPLPKRQLDKLYEKHNNNIQTIAEELITSDWVVMARMREATQ